MSVGPPPAMIVCAIAQAQESPCAKSRRGVVAFARPDRIHGYGYNTPVEPCTEDAACRAICAKRCIHAEVVALTQAVNLGSAVLELLHVKIDEYGKVVAGGPPSCWSCANQIAQRKDVDGIWLYEDLFEGHQWVYWDSKLFFEATVMRQPDHPRFAPIAGIDVPCRTCGGSDGARRSITSQWHCRRCGCGE